MIGRVDEEGRALVSIKMGAAKNALVHEVDVWVDTGFNGDLVLPKLYIDEVKVPHVGTAKAVLADGSEVSLKVHLCLIEWFGEIRELNVVANDGSNPLLGVGLLIGRDLRVSYRSMTVEIE